MICLAEIRDVRTAAAMAMSDFGVHPEGREILRREGALRPLVLLLGEGIESAAAEQAAKALMTLAASDINKVFAMTELCPLSFMGNSCTSSRQCRPFWVLLAGHAYRIHIIFNIALAECDALADGCFQAHLLVTLHICSVVSAGCH